MPTELEPIEMEVIPETDQWKLDGDCMLCRRASYCHDKDGKGCGPIKRKRKEAVKAEAKKKMAEMFGVSPDEIEYGPNGQIILNRKNDGEVVDVETNEEAPDTNKTDSNE